MSGDSSKALGLALNRLGHVSSAISCFRGGAATDTAHLRVSMRSAMTIRIFEAAIVSLASAISSAVSDCF